MNISQHLDKNNLHHAYLIEGVRDEIVPEIKKFLKGLDIKTSGNSDFIHISIDNFKIEEAFYLRSMSSDKSFSSNKKKIFLICVNSFSLDAQNVLLKMFEEPIVNTHFFLIVPDADALLKTLVSRFYVISPKTILKEGVKEAEKFIAMTLNTRINFLKNFLIEDDKNEEIAQTDSTRAKSLRFLNALEFVLHQRTMSKRHFDINYFEHFFKVREFLRMPGSSAKSLMESVALIIPVLD